MYLCIYVLYIFPYILHNEKNVSQTVHQIKQAHLCKK